MSSLNDSGALLFRCANITSLWQGNGLQRSRPKILSNVAIAMVAICIVTATAQETTSTGFYWPTGTNSLGNYAKFLSMGCGGDDGYFSGEYHPGLDIQANLGSAVYAIADGRVIHRSTSGWGDGNVALIIRHTLRNGFGFQAFYGHIRSDIQPGQTVYAGRPIGTIGPWPNGYHLHFGIRLDINPDLVPPAPYGRMPCSSWPSTNQ